MKKYSIVLLLLTLAALIVLAACSGDSETPGTGNGQGEGTAGAGEDRLDLRVYMRQAAHISDLKDNLLTEIVEDMFNVNLLIDASPAQGAAERQNLLLASGDYPPVFLGGDFSKIDMMRYGGLGVLIPLNDLIEQHAPNIVRAFEEKPYLKEGLTAPDGNIYGLPHVEECYHCNYAQKMWINTEWLDRLNLTMPATTTELEQVLLAFKNRDPNGNGSADEIPLTGATQSWQAEPIGFLMNAFIYHDDSNYLRAVNGRVDFVANQAEWRQGLEYIRDLYAQGLIDPQAFTQNDDAMLALGNNAGDALVGAFTAGHMGMGVSIREDNDSRWLQYHAVPPLSGPSGLKQATYFGGNVENGQFALTDKATEAEQVAAMKIANYLFSLEGSVNNGFGVKGVGWVDAAPGELGLNGQQAIFKTTFEGQPVLQDGETQNWHWEVGPAYWPEQLFDAWQAEQDVTTPEGYELFLVQETNKYAGSVPDELVPPSMFVQEDIAQALAQMQTDIKSYVKQNAIQFITGGQNLDTGWDAYVRGFQGLKLDDYVKIYQDYLDSK